MVLSRFLVHFEAVLNSMRVECLDLIFDSALLEAMGIIEVGLTKAFLLFRYCSDVNSKRKLRLLYYATRLEKTDRQHKSTERESCTAS